MGGVACRKHGDQFGQVACKHVVLAVYGVSRLSGEPVEFTVDYLDDGRWLATWSACEDCARALGALAGGVISGSKTERPGFSIACGVCYRDWRSRPASSSEDP
jgi:hypothetical protein